MPLYVAKRIFFYKGRPVAKGDELELTERQAVFGLRAGRLELAVTKAPAPKSTAKPAAAGKSTRSPAPDAAAKAKE